MLSPVLFSLFVNDITECAAENVSVQLFADDAKICTVIIDGKPVVINSSIVLI